MTRISELTGRELRWMKAGRGAYALRDGDDTLATLRFPSLWRSLATAESADGCCTFKRAGFMQTRATVRACGGESGKPLLRFTKIGGMFSWSSNVEILRSTSAVKSAPWLVMLGWYLSVQMRKDAAAG